MDLVLIELLKSFKKPDMTVLTFEGTSASGVYDMTNKVRNANLVLTNARLDTTGTAPKSVILEIDGTVSNEYVIDNIPETNYFRHMVYYNPVTLGGITNISQYQPMIGYKMSGEINRQAKFVIRDGSTGAELSNLAYFFFEFAVI